MIEIKNDIKELKKKINVEWTNPINIKNYQF